MAGSLTCNWCQVWLATGPKGTRICNLGPSQDDPHASVCCRCGWPIDDAEYKIPSSVLHIVEMLAERGMLQVFPLVIDRDDPAFKAYKMPGIGVIWNKFRGGSITALEAGDFGNLDSELVDIAWHLMQQGATVTNYSSLPDVGEEFQAVVVDGDRMVAIEVIVSPQFHRRMRDVPHDQCFGYKS